MNGNGKCLLMFSGGRDSWLSCCRLVEQGFHVQLVHFNNGRSVGAANLTLAVERMNTVYRGQVEFIGSELIDGIWREFFLPYMTMTPAEVMARWGELPFSQFCCLTCRTAMYVWSIIYCKNRGLSHIAEGARKSQNWPIMQERMIDRYASLTAQYGLELLVPVLDVETNWERKNELLRRGFIPKVLESQCLLGVALPYASRPPAEVEAAVESFFDSFLRSRATDLIEKEILAASRVGIERQAYQ